MYQSSHRGLGKLIERLRGARGYIENGYHVLAPIDIDCLDDKVEAIFHWKLYSIKYLKSVVRICRDIFDGKNITIVLYNDLKKKLDDWIKTGDINLNNELSKIKVVYKS